MRNRLPSVLLGIALLAGVARGADPAAPLESSRQELRKLESGQTPKNGPTATEGLRPNLPTIQTPGQESLQPLQLTDQEKLEKERKRQKDERKNWLVNGVEELERKDRATEAGAFIPEENQADENSTRSPDGADPQYLLKLYDEQKKIDDAQKAEVKPQRAPQADPLAPFLQGWLGNSPVRGQFFDEFVRKPEGTAATGHAVPIGEGSRRNFEPVGERTPKLADDLPKPNPYLVEMAKPMPVTPSGGNRALENTLNSATATPLFSKPLPPPAEPPANLQQPEKKPFPAPLADDKKYFPQLKKF